MPKNPLQNVSAAQLRKETEEWLASHTIPTMRSIAKDLENAGEDVHDLFAAIDDLESLVRRKPTKLLSRPAAKAKA